MAAKKKHGISVKTSEERAHQANGIDNCKLNVELKLIDKAKAHSVILLNNQIKRVKIAERNVESSSGSSTVFLKKRRKEVDEKNKSYFMYGERLESRKYYKRSSLLWDKVESDDEEEEDEEDDKKPDYPPLESLLESSSEEEGEESEREGKEDIIGEPMYECDSSTLENTDSGFAESTAGSCAWSRSSSPIMKSTHSQHGRSAPSSACERSVFVSYEELPRPHTSSGLHVQARPHTSGVDNSMGLHLSTRPHTSGVDNSVYSHFPTRSHSSGVDNAMGLHLPTRPHTSGRVKAKGLNLPIRPHTTGTPGTRFPTKDNRVRPSSAVIPQPLGCKFSWWHGIIDYSKRKNKDAIPTGPGFHINSFFPQLGDGWNEETPQTPTEDQAEKDKKEAQKKKRKPKRTWEFRRSVYAPTVSSRQKHYSTFLIGKSSHKKNSAVD